MNKPRKYEVIIDDLDIRKLNKILRKFKESGIIILAVRIEVLSDERVYGYRLWYPVSIKPIDKRE